MDAADRIVEIVESKQGLKSGELIAELGKDVTEDTLDDIEFSVKQGLISEIEYTVPQVPNRLKSFYLPAGARVVSITIGGFELNLSKLADLMYKIDKIAG